jgi:hypothetical protein
MTSSAASSISARVAELSAPILRVANAIGSSTLPLPRLQICSAEDVPACNHWQVQKCPNSWLGGANKWDCVNSVHTSCEASLVVVIIAWIDRDVGLDTG